MPRDGSSRDIQEDPATTAAKMSAMTYRHASALDASAIAHLHTDS
jgi:hypothetical protein